MKTYVDTRLIRHARCTRCARRATAMAATLFATTMLAALALFTACTDLDDAPDGPPSATDAISFAATLSAPVGSGTRAATPATKDAFATGDRIAVSIDQQIKPYAYTADLRFCAAHPDNAFYWTPGTQQQQDVIAWYPYSAALPSATAPLDISRQDTDEGFAAADFLFAGPATLQRTPSSALTFGHRTALMRLNIKADGKTVVPGNDFTITEVWIEGTQPQALIDPANGTLKGTGNTAPILAHPCPATAAGHLATFEAHIIPHDISVGTIISIYASDPGNPAAPDKMYTGIILSGSYQAGHIHTYNVTLSSDRIHITPTDEDLSWNEGNIETVLPAGYDIAISTAQELQAFATAVNSGGTIGNPAVDAYSARVLQTADIDLVGIDDWTPIGNSTSSSSNYFQGIYNGNGYTISNLKIKSEKGNSGLFGQVSGKDSSTPAVLTGIHLRNVDIDVSCNSPISCGAIAGSVSRAVITFCSARGEIKTYATNSHSYSGGIIGKNNSGTISYCRADVKVTASSDVNQAQLECYAGGIVGYNNGTIFACEASGSEVSAISNNAQASAGGIVGRAKGSSYIASCASEVGKIIANISGNGFYAYAGGVVGEQNGALYSSYARGDATASGGGHGNMAGAIVGNNASGNTNFCIGTGAGGQGTSNLAASARAIDYKADATDYEIYDIMQLGAIVTMPYTTISTTTYDPTRFPAYGIEVKQESLTFYGGWDYAAATGKIRLPGLPPIAPP